MSPERRAQAEKCLSYKFKNQALLSRALCHGSTRDQGLETNERLEFLGDAVLSLLAAWFLYEGNAGSDEGELSRRRAQLTSGESLAKIADRLGLARVLMTAKGQDVAASPGMLGDALEAIIGAMFLDGGLEPAQDFVIREVLAPPKETATKKAEEADKPPEDFEDPKSKLQHHTLRLRLGLPEYRVVEAEGPGHSLTFTMEVLVQGSPIGRGQGSSKKTASQEAARQALVALLASEEDTRKVEELAATAPAKKAAKKSSKKAAKKGSKKSAN